MTIEKEREKRWNAIRTLPSWALRELTRKFIEEEGVTQMQFAELVTEFTKIKISGATVSNLVSGRSQNPAERTLDAVKHYLAEEDALSKFGMPIRPAQKKPEEPTVLPPLLSEPQLPLPTGRTKRYIHVSIDDSDFIDILSSLGSSAALPPARRQQLIRLLFPQDFPHMP
jgi:hypothetical protein